MSNLSIKIAASVAIIGGMIAGAVSASAALNLPSQSCAYMFNTNMKLGSSGTDVMNLQKTLNMWPQTQVSESGAGSPGMETSYFGAATRRAVNKFHALHLVELGITAPTGNVFAGTRGLLNMACNGTVSTNPGTTPPGTNPGTVISGPVSAMLASSQPTGMIVQGQSGALLANIAFSGNGTVTSVQLQRIGVSADATLTNVYLYDGNTRITDAASVVTGGYINFNAPSGLFSVNGTRVISVRADVAGSTSGQSVGVKLNSVTAGGSASTYSNVVGNQLQIANISTATVNFSTITQSPSTGTVNAGTQAYNVWSGNATVSIRDVNFRAATFKFVGSAPVDAMANLSLYIDGTKVAGPSMINAMNNNKVTFDLGNTPFLLKTGGHTIDVRGDVVKGSARTMSFSIENVADLMFEDTNLIGVNVSATVNSAAMTQSNTLYRTDTISTGSVTVNVDPAFTANKVTGGATNVPVGQFTMKAYGEDVKVNTLQVTFATATVTTLNNVSLYVNGGQVGTSQNFLGTAVLSYNLGSSLIIPAGQTVTFTVKADIVNSSNAAWTTGSIATVIGGVASNAQGQSSSEIVSVASSAVTGNTLTVSSGVGTFARTAGFTGVTIAPNSSAVKIGSFTLQANSAENIKVNSIGVNPVVTLASQTNVSNLTVKMGSTVLGTPIGNPSSGTSTFSFSDITVNANQTATFDVYADIGGDVDGVVTTHMQINSRGAVSNTTTVSDAAGIAITSALSSLATSTLVSSSPTSQFVVGGSTFGIATFKLSTLTSGTQATVRELRFGFSGLADAITSVTVGGVTSPVVAGSSTVSGLNIVVSSTGTDVPVTVKYSGFQNSTSGGSLTAGGLSTTTLTYVEAVAGSGSVITNTVQSNGNGMYLVASKPTVTVSAGNTNALTLSSVAESKVGEFTITADANGKIAVASTTLAISGNNMSSYQVSSPRIADGNTTITGSVSTGSSTIVSSFTTPYEIAAGQSKTFSVYAVVNGTLSGTNPAYITSVLTATTSFKWIDVIGTNAMLNASYIYNFPTNNYSTTR